MEKNKKYFNLEEYLNKINVSPNEGENIVIISSVRNCGKSVNTTKYILDYWKKWNYTRRVAFVRTNDLIMTKWKNSFKNAWEKNNIFIEGNIIFKYWFKEVDENQKKKIKTKSEMVEKKEEIGYFVDVMNEANYRSLAEGGFHDYHFVFYEEFNEGNPQRDYYKHFINLLSTIKRQSKPFFVLLLGNKINANNDIFVNYNLNVNRRSLNEDWLQAVADGIYYIDIGFNTFKHLNNEKSFINRLASYNEDTNRLFNEGGFLEGTIYNVINKNEFKNKLIKYNFIIDDLMYEYGECDLYGENKKVYYLENIKNPTNEVIALNNRGYTFNNAYMVDKDDLNQIADTFFEQLKNNSLFYDSFNTMLIIEDWLLKYETIFEK